MRRTVTLLTLLLLAAVGSSSAEGGGDWPQFRGPNRDGISPQNGLLSSWSSDGPAVLWRAASGSGFSGMSVVGKRLYTMLGREDGEYVVALDANSGGELWARRVDDLYKNQFGNGPRSTPTVDGDAVYAVSAQGILVALSTADGALRWQNDLRQSFGARVPTWGVSASPLVDGDRLVVEVGGKAGYSIVAFDKTSGSVAWHSGNDQPGYASPILIEQGGVRQLVFLTGTKIIGLAPASGEALWEKTWRTSYDVNASIPIFIAPNKLFISTGYDTGAALFTLMVRDGKIVIEESWRTRGMKNQFQASVVHDGTIYGFDNTTFKALDLASGDERWKARGWGHGSLIYADGHLIVLGDKGKLGIVRANPSSYEEVASAELLQGKSWTVPTLTNGVLYIRNEREIVALKIAG